MWHLETVECLSSLASSPRPCAAAVWEVPSSTENKLQHSARVLHPAVCRSRRRGRGWSHLLGEPAQRVHQTVQAEKHSKFCDSWPGESTYVLYGRKLWGVQKLADFLGATKLKNYTPCEIFPLYSITYMVLHTCVCILHTVNMTMGKHSAVHVCCVVCMHECGSYLYICCMMCGANLLLSTLSVLLASHGADSSQWWALKEHHIMCCHLCMCVHVGVCVYVCEFVLHSYVCACRCMCVCEFALHMCVHACCA